MKKTKEEKEKADFLLLLLFFSTRKYMGLKTKLKPRKMKKAYFKTLATCVNTLGDNERGVTIVKRNK